MRFRALKYGEYFVGQVLVCRHKRGLFVIFKECVDAKHDEWCVRLESDAGINTGSILQLEEGVLCEIVKKRGTIYHARFLKTVSEKSRAWIEQNLMAIA
ncbi:MAG: hypothetical protein FDX30_08610 [Chlorobium sp.]|nr:MAG: hypothetical protein FDX30_08610 [Chlorobium sp.]